MVFDAHFLSCFADVKHLPLSNKRKMLSTWGPWAHSPRTPGAQGWMMLTPWQHLQPCHQPIRELCTSPSRALWPPRPRCCMRGSGAWLFAMLWTIAHQAPLSMGLSQQEYWSGFPCPPPGDLPGPGIEPWGSCIGRQILYHWATWEALPAPTCPLKMLCWSPSRSSKLCGAWAASRPFMSCDKPSLLHAPTLQFVWPHCASCTATRVNTLLREPPVSRDQGQDRGSSVPSIREQAQVLQSCTAFIERYGIVDGIYRLSGVASNIQRLR